MKMKNFLIIKMKIAKKILNQILMKMIKIYKNQKLVKIVKELLKIVKIIIKQLDLQESQDIAIENPNNYKNYLRDQLGELIKNDYIFL